MRIVLTMAALVTYGFASIATADVLDDRWYVSPMYTYTDEDDRKSNNGNGGTIAIGKPVSKFWNVEGALFGSEFASDGPGEPRYDEWGGKINALLVMRRNGWSPYLTGGVGFVHTGRPDSPDDSTDPMAELGAGVIVPVNDYGMGIRAEGVYRYIDYDSDFPNVDHIDEKQANVGLYIPLERPQGQVDGPPPPVVDREPEIYDSDGDGVHDKVDACPNTVAGVPVDRHGCALQTTAPPQPEPAPVQVAPVYTQPAPVQVQPAVVGRTEYRHETVEHDTDGDGVADRLDACPNTSVGAVDEIGCYIGHARYR